MSTVSEIRERNIRVLAAREALDFDKCLIPEYGTPEMRVYKRADGLARGEFKLLGDYVVCSTCGGNCGQCGVTGTVDDVPASMRMLADSMYKRRSVPREPVDLSQHVNQTLLFTLVISVLTALLVSLAINLWRFT